jgi:hypothetical protein
MTPCLRAVAEIVDEKTDKGDLEDEKDRNDAELPSGEIHFCDEIGVVGCCS